MALATLPKIGMSAREFLSASEAPDRRNIVELFEGALVMNPMPIPDHQTIVFNVQRALDEWSEQTQSGRVLGGVDVQIGPETVLVPDVLFISHKRLAAIDRTHVKAAPDLVVEVLSPSTRLRDQTLKRRLYAEAGVKEYWLVDPELRAVEVLVLKGKFYRSLGVVKANTAVSSPLLGETAIPLRQIFRGV